MDQLAIDSVLHLIKTQRNGRHIDEHLEIVPVHIGRLVQNLVGQFGGVRDRLRGEHLIGLIGHVEGGSGSLREGQIHVRKRGVDGGIGGSFRVRSVVRRIQIIGLHEVSDLQRARKERREQKRRNRIEHFQEVDVVEVIAVQEQRVLHAVQKHVHAFRRRFVQPQRTRPRLGDVLIGGCLENAFACTRVLRVERNAVGLTSLLVDGNMRSGRSSQPVGIGRAFPHVFSVSLLHNARQHAPIKIDRLRIKKNQKESTC